MFHSECPGATPHFPSTPRRGSLWAWTCGRSFLATCGGSCTCLAGSSSSNSSVAGRSPRRFGNRQEMASLHPTGKSALQSTFSPLYFVYRWTSKHCLTISVTAHPKIKSLFHLAGLTGPLRELRVARAVTEGWGIGGGGGGGRWNSIKEGVESLPKLKGLLGGGYLQVQHSEGGNYHVLINPGEHSVRGHVLSVCI